MIFHGVNHKMSFKKNLQNILNELKKKKKKSSINYYVKERLEKSLNQYYKELNNSINYLSDDRDVIKLAKKINK